MGREHQEKNAVGQRVRFMTLVERYPFCLIEPGETGTVAHVSEDLITVKMDRQHEGLAEWNNEVHFDEPNEFFAATMRLLPQAPMTICTQEVTLKGILDAMQEADEMGGTRDYADYAALMTAVMREARARLTGMMGNLPDCACGGDKAEPCDACKAKQIVEEAGLL